MSNLPRRSGPRCPDDAAHGTLVDWPTGSWGFHCPSHHHDDAGTVPFFTTAEAEAGVPVRRERRGADLPAAALRRAALRPALESAARFAGGTGAASAEGAADSRVGS